jgi:hypothetical protein
LISGYLGDNTAVMAWDNDLSVAHEDASEGDFHAIMKISDL